MIDERSGCNLILSGLPALVCSEQGKSQTVAVGIDGRARGTNEVLSFFNYK
jgi:hypothetical protein